MTKIYHESFRYFLASLPALLAFGAAIEVTLWLLQPKQESAVSFVALTLVAYYFHRHFLFRESLSFSAQKPAPGAPPFKFGWFMLTSAAVLLTPVGIGLFIVFAYLDQPSPGAMILIFLPLYLVTLGLFGTALPATVARDGTYRVSQGVRATFSTMGRLVLGPGVIGFVLLVATLLAGNALGSLGVADDSLVALAFHIVLRTLGFLTTILAVAVLCEMYRKTRPEPRLPLGPGTLDQTPA
jgi:hypothetical protein